MQKEGEEVLQAPEIPQQPMVRQLCPCSPWRSMVELVSTCSPWGTTHQSRGMPEGGCDPVRSPCWSRLLAGPVASWREEQHWSRFDGRPCDHGGQPRWSRLFLKDCALWKGHTLEQFMKNCSLWEGLTLEKCMEDCLSWDKPHAGAGQACEGPPPEEEGAAETTCSELTATPIPHSPMLLDGRR
ncbi:hypothetical protein BTVI_11505 [Pitangus sulphuratus]|nr:hypothetical protein BTVI_11505 [Pitangus sulphuratus]